MVTVNGASVAAAAAAAPSHRHYRSQHLWRLLPYVGATSMLMQCAYLALFRVYERGHTALIGLPPPLDPIDCANDASNDKCGQSDQFAFQIVSGITFLVIGGWAFCEWHIVGVRRDGNGSWKNSSSTTAALANNSSSTVAAVGRLYGHHGAAQWITVINLGYQLWDFGISWTIPEYCTVIMMSHHAAAAVVAWSALYNDMLSYYALFFMGASEISSIWLVSLDVAKYFALRPGSLAQFFFQHVTGPVFVVTFVYYRVILWWPCSLQLLRDVRHVTVTTNQAAQLRGKSRTWILYLWLALNFPLGLLQLYWLSLILDEAKAVVAAL